MLSKWKLMPLIIVILISAGAMMISTTMSGCSNEKAVDPAIEQADNLRVDLPEQATEGVVDIESAGIPEISASEADSGEVPVIAGAWWSSLSQSQRNHQIVVEALYSVDRDIWGQNSRISDWNCYLSGGCPLMGNWPYSYRFPGRVGYGGTCKNFANELVRRASGWATSLPPGSNFIGIFPFRNKVDAIAYAQAGEILQFTGSGLHTAVIISNFHDGRFEVVDSNWSWPYDYKIRKHVIDTYKSGSKWTSATLRSYVINH